MTQEQLTDLTGAPISENALTYDAVGNRLTKTTTPAASSPITTTYAYNVADQLLSEDGITYTYDLAGRLSSRTDGSGTTQYRYDFEDRLVEISGPAGTTTYQYDADGHRVEKRDASGTARYLVDPIRAHAQVLALAGYVYAENLISMTRGSETFFYHTDGLGSTRLLTGSSGSVTDSYDYNAFGTLIAGAGTTENPFLFTGQHLDAIPGLYYLRARYYEPRTGRFNARDTWDGQDENPLTWQRYIYAGNNPVNFSDPSGRQWSLATVTVTMATLGALTGATMYTALHQPGEAEGERFTWSGAVVWTVSGAAAGATVGYLGWYAWVYWGPPVLVEISSVTYGVGRELVNRWPSVGVLRDHFIRHGQQVAQVIRATSYTIDQYAAHAAHFRDHAIYRRDVGGAVYHIAYLGLSEKGGRIFALVIEKGGKIVTFHPIRLAEAVRRFPEFSARVGQ